jgi:hypothetical protein
VATFSLRPYRRLLGHSRHLPAVRIRSPMAALESSCGSALSLLLLPRGLSEGLTRSGFGCLVLVYEQNHPALCDVVHTRQATNESTCGRPIADIHELGAMQWIKRFLTKMRKVSRFTKSLMRNWKPASESTKEIQSRFGSVLLFIFAQAPRRD